MKQEAINLESPSLAVARAVGEEAGNRAAGRAERAVSDFREKAAAFMLRFLAENGGVSSSELMTDAAVQSGIKVSDTRAFGPVFQSLAREDKIAFDGYVRRTKGHGSAGGKRWRLVLG